MPPDPATDPSPGNFAADVPTAVVLGWTAGAFSESHDVYFGTDPTPDNGEFQGNQDFFLNTVAWLSQDKDLISIRPREAEDQRMMLTQQQQADVRWVALVYLPGLFVVLGVATWWRRRG